MIPSIEKMAELNKLLDMSIKLRKVFGLPNKGTVMVQRIKPSGTYDIKVVISLDGKIQKTLTEKRYKELMK